MIFRDPSLDSASHQSGCVPLSFLIQQDAQAWNPPFFQGPRLVVGAMPAGMVGAGSGAPVPAASGPLCSRGGRQEFVP